MTSRQSRRIVNMESRGSASLGRASEFLAAERALSWMVRAALAVSFVLVCALAAACGTPGPKAPTGPVSRPADVHLWAHADSGSEWLRRITVAWPDLLPFSASMIEERLVAFDISRPLDVAFTTQDDGTVDFAIAIQVRSEEAFTRTLAAFGPVDKNGGFYVRAASKTARPAKSASAAMRIDMCELEERPLRAVCGTSAGVAKMGPWLRTAPSAPRGEFYMELVLAPLRHTIAPIVAGLKRKAIGMNLDLGKLLDDTESLVVYARDGGNGNIEGAIDLTLTNRRGPIPTALFEGAQKTGTSASLVHHLAVPGGMVATSNGGDGLSALYLKWLVDDGAKPARPAWSGVEALAKRPHALLFRIDTTLVSATLGSARDAGGASGRPVTALADALGGFLVVASEADIGEVKAALKSLYGFPTKAPRKTAVGSCEERPVDVSAHLPKGAFVFDEILGEAVRTGGRTEVPRRTALLAFPYEGVTYVIFRRSNEEQLVKMANEIRATRYMPLRNDTASLPSIAYSGTVDPRFAQLHAEVTELAPTSATWKRIGEELVAPERPHLEYRILARELDGKPVLSLEARGAEREVITTYLALMHTYLGRDR